MRKLWSVIKRAKEVWDWFGLIWQIAGALSLTGIVVAVASTAWAMVRGLPGPFILMGAFCTFVAALWLALAPLALRAFARASVSPVAKDSLRPNYAAWRNRAYIHLGDAACLFADQTPTAHIRSDPKVREYLGSLIDAARNGEMAFPFRSAEEVRTTAALQVERSYVDANTQVTLDALKAFARKRLYSPPFLRDE
jgi:hypothetical protein